MYLSNYRHRSSATEFYRHWGTFFFYIFTALYELGHVLSRFPFFSRYKIKFDSLIKVFVETINRNLMAFIKVTVNGRKRGISFSIVESTEKSL